MRATLWERRAVPAVEVRVSRSGLRKACPATTSDDEAELVEGPTALTGRRAGAPTLSA